jgi:hypothetical protein
MQKGFSRMYLMKKDAAGVPERIEDLLALTDTALAKIMENQFLQLLCTDRSNGG